jgi:hypothetical protein
MGFFTAGIFFLRFWRTSQDRFFLLLAVAFGLEAISRLIMGLVELPDNFPLVYLIRLCSFSMILFAILDKNRPSKR